MESSIITILSQEKNKMMKLEEITKELKVQDTTKLPVSYTHLTLPTTERV